MEGMIAHLFKECLDRKLPLPFPQISYREAMSRFGKDNPDIRFGLELRDLTDIFKGSGFKLFAEIADGGGVIEAICIEDGKRLSRKDLDELKDYVAQYGAGGPGLGQGQSGRLDIADLQVSYAGGSGRHQRKNGGARRET